MLSPHTFDVVVVGGGPAGVTAAVSAARLGGNTLLVEQSDRLGGTALYGMHPFICGLYRNDSHIPFDMLNNGIAAEIVSRLDKLSSKDGRRRMGRVELHAVRSDLYSKVLTELTRAEHGLSAALRSRLTSTTVRGDALVRLELEGEAAGVVGGGCVIDCTGHGDVMRRCRAGREPATDEWQMAGFCLRLSRIRDPEGVATIKVPYHIREAIDKGVLPSELRYTVFSPDDEGTSGICKLSLLPGSDRKGRASAWDLGDRVHEMLRQETREFRNSVIDERSPWVLERSGMSLIGDYRLTAEDVLRGRRFPDGCVRAAWPVEFWELSSGPTLDYLEPGAFYEVPSRCLHSSRVSNLFAAGRCISATERALASVRVTGTCFALGEAAARLALGIVPTRNHGATKKRK